MACWVDCDSRQGPLLVSQILVLREETESQRICSLPHWLSVSPFPDFKTVFIQWCVWEQGRGLQCALGGIMKNSHQLLSIESEGHRELSLGGKTFPRQGLWPGQTWSLEQVWRGWCSSAGACFLGGSLWLVVLCPHKHGGTVSGSSHSPTTTLPHPAVPGTLGNASLQGGCCSQVSGSPVCGPALSSWVGVSYPLSASQQGWNYGAVVRRGG